MNRKLLAGITCAALVLASLACQIFSVNRLAVQPTSTPVVVRSPTQAADEPTLEATVIDVQATSQADKENRAATQEAGAQAATRAVAETASAKATAAEANRLERTAQVEAKATEQAAEMAGVVQDLKSKGILTSTAGTFHMLEDFKENWAQLGWYQWWPTGYRPADFVIRAHTGWESASKTADWFSSGCGFVFRAKDESNHYLIYLALDSNVYLKGYINGTYRELGKGYAGKMNYLKGEADVMLVVQGEKITYYVNDQKVFERENKSLREGDLGLTLVSGTNLDYGTRCEMTNIELWDLSQ